MFSQKKILAGMCVFVSLGILQASAALNSKQILDKVGLERGVCVVLGDPSGELALDLVRQSEFMVYVQMPRAENVEKARRAADAANVYGPRIFIDQGALSHLHLADNLADVVVAVGDISKVSEAEVLRILRPQGKALLGQKEIVKPFPKGIDDWSHPFHGPDNNPQSNDKVIRAPYLTQFMAEPRYAPLTQVAVASAGRVFKGYGNIAFHTREEPYLNTLVAYDGYNGTMLWKRDLVPGIMLHRNTIVASPDVLYVGDDRSCKMIDTATGKLIDEIKPPLEKAGGTFWKWMGLENGVLYALIGEQEQKDKVMTWKRTGHGWPWNHVSQGYNQKKHEWGFGKNLLAIDPKTKKVLWSHSEDEAVDSRAVCMANGRIFIFRFGSYLTCLSAETGQEIWRKTVDNAPRLFEALGKYLNRQDWRTNWRTIVYLKCTDKLLYFAGPQIGKLLAISAEDGQVVWENKYSNFQLVIQDEALYGISGPWRNNYSKKFDLLTGTVLAELPTGRRACALVTGAGDALFYRAMGGTVRFDLASHEPQYISPMRAQCHDGVTVANGMLYWWPSVCDCQLTIYGVTACGPAGDFQFNQQAVEQERLEVAVDDLSNIKPLEASPADWPMFRKDVTCSATNQTVLGRKGKLLWKWKGSKNSAFTPTTPVVVDELVFFCDSDGRVRALDVKTGKEKWIAYTGGEIRFPPTIWNNRAYVGSGDGWIYCYEAATGRLLWRFRAAPQERMIPVYGSFLSTWPVASGVMIDDGVAYAAAGLVNYDGTHVYALDALTGRIKWQNNTSGHLYQKARTGVSVQGHMMLHDGKLYMAGGNAVSPAVYDIKDGKCLNNVEHLKNCESCYPRGWELFLVGDKVIVCGKPFYGDPKYPVYDRTVSTKMHHTTMGDRDIVWMNDNVVRCYTNINRKYLSDCVRPAKTKDVRHVIGIWGELKLPVSPVWNVEAKGSEAVAVCSNAVVVAKNSELVALDLQSGSVCWSQPLPASPVRWGLAVDRDGRAVVSLTDGTVMCFQ